MKEHKVKVIVLRVENKKGKRQRARCSWKSLLQSWRMICNEH